MSHTTSLAVYRALVFNLWSTCIGLPSAWLSIVFLRPEFPCHMGVLWPCALSLLPCTEHFFIIYIFPGCGLLEFPQVPLALSHWLCHFITPHHSRVLWGSCGKWIALFWCLPLWKTQCIQFFRLQFSYLQASWWWWGLQPELVSEDKVWYGTRMACQRSAFILILRVLSVSRNK